MRAVTPHTTQRILEPTYIRMIHTYTCTYMRAVTPHTTQRILGPMSKLTVPSYKPWLDENDGK